MNLMQAVALKEISVIVRKMLDEEATVLMVNTNIQREEIFNYAETL